MKQVILFALIALTLSSCAGGWHDDDKANYLYICQQDARFNFNTDEETKAYCECSLEKLMALYPKMEDVIINKDSLKAAEQLNACRDQVLSATP